MRFLSSQCIMLCTAVLSYMQAYVLFAIYCGLSALYCLSTVHLLPVYFPSTLTDWLLSIPALY